eukprot:c47212_g1_i1 orf=1403-2077(+)
MADITSRCTKMYSSMDVDGSEFGTCESPRALVVLSLLFERIVARNEKRILVTNGTLSSQRLTIFHGLKAPSITINKYLERIFRYANCSPSCFVVAYIYIDRFMQQQAGLPITSLNIHRLLITTVMVAAKFLDDEYYNNAYYAKVGGVSTTEMNRLELEFLFRIGFRLQVTVDVFGRYCSHLQRECSSEYLLERTLQLNCGLKGNSGEDDPQKYGVATKWSCVDA